MNWCDFFSLQTAVHRHTDSPWLRNSLKLPSEAKIVSVLGCYKNWHLEGKRGFHIACMNFSFQPFDLAISKRGNEKTPEEGSKKGCR